MAGQPIAKITAGGGTHVIAPSFYATCDTAANTAAKVAKLADTNVNAATFVTGMALWVKFTHNNTVANPTLTLQTSSGTQILAAKSLMRYGTTTVSTNTATSWQPGAVVCFVYDGTNWVETTGIDANATYTAATAAPAVIPSSTASVTGTSTNYARQDHTHGLSKAAVTAALGYTPSTSDHTHPRTSLTNPTITSRVQTNDSTRFFWNATNVNAYKDVNGTIFFDGTMNIRLGLTAWTVYDNAYILKIDGSALSGYAGGIGVAGNFGLLDVHANGYMNFRPVRDVAAGTNNIPIRGIIY